jgi:hypothetical protein
MSTGERLPAVARIGALAFWAFVVVFGWQQLARRALRAVWWWLRGAVSLTWTCQLCQRPARLFAGRPRAAENFCRSCWRAGLFGGDDE